MKLATYQTIEVSEEHPEVHCATGFGSELKCPWFISRLVSYLFLADIEKPHCSKYVRDLKMDATSVLRFEWCQRDFGPDAQRPGRCQRVALEEIANAPSAADSIPVGHVGLPIGRTTGRISLVGPPARYEPVKSGR